jgi:hypothetical protein
MVESKYPGANLSFLIGKTNRKEHLLRHPKYEKELHRLLNSKISYEKKIPKMEEICDAFGEYVSETSGVRPLRRQDRDQIRAEMDGIGLDLDASAFVRMLLAEFSFCERYGQKRSVENCEEGCHYTGYLCHQIKNCASNRLPMSIKQYAQGLAWLMEDSETDIEHVKLVIPYTLAHRVQWKDDMLLPKEKTKKASFPFPGERSGGLSRGIENRATISKMPGGWVRSFKERYWSLWREIILYMESRKTLWRDDRETREPTVPHRLRDDQEGRR